MRFGVNLHCLGKACSRPTLAKKIKGKILKVVSQMRSMEQYPPLKDKVEPVWKIPAVTLGNWWITTYWIGLSSLVNYRRNLSAWFHSFIDLRNAHLLYLLNLQPSVWKGSGWLFFLRSIQEALWLLFWVGFTDYIVIYFLLFSCNGLLCIH